MSVDNILGNSPLYVRIIKNWLNCESKIMTKILSQRITFLSIKKHSNHIYQGGTHHLSVTLRLHTPTALGREGTNED